MGNRVFALRKISDPSDQYLRIFGSNYAGNFKCFINEFDQKYLESIINFIRSRTRESVPQWFEMIKKNEEIISKIKDTKREEKIKKIEFKNYVYKEINNNTYEVFLKVNPFVYKKKDNYYFFEKKPYIKVGTTIRITPDNIKIESPAKVLNIPFYHPHVHGKNSFEPEGTICYHSKARFKSQGIEFQSQNIAILKNSNSRRRFAKQVAFVLNEGKNALQFGYMGKVGPVYTLSPSNFKDEYIGKKLTSRYSIYKLCDNDRNWNK